MGIIGTPIDGVTTLDKKYIKDDDDFEKKVSVIQLKREVTGEISIYSWMQPFHRPEVEALLERRIDYLFVFDKGTLTEQLFWCQGEVTEVHKNQKKPNTVKVC